LFSHLPSWLSGLISPPLDPEIIVEKANFVDCHMGVIVSRPRMRIDDFHAKLRSRPVGG
jgi:hypothetical protein